MLASWMFNGISPSSWADQLSYYTKPHVKLSHHVLRKVSLEQLKDMLHAAPAHDHSSSASAVQQC